MNKFAKILAVVTAESIGAALLLAVLAALVWWLLLPETAEAFK